MESEDMIEMLEEEMAALEAILMDDVTVIRNLSGSITSVEVLIAPATAQNVSEQHVKCTLVATFPPDYPLAQPLVIIRNPRGVDENVVKNIELQMKVKCEECEGSQVIYELTEVVRDELTDNNAPSCPCAICLYHFTPSDLFTKTHCFHYFHKHCLGRYISNCEMSHSLSVAEQQLTPWQQQKVLVLLCPVCREPISLQETSEALLSCPSPKEDEETTYWASDNPDIIALREKMANLFLKQKQNGGIIDLEEEKNKYLVNLTQEDPPATIPEEASPVSDEGAPGDTSGKPHPESRETRPKVAAKSNGSIPSVGEGSSKSVYGGRGRAGGSFGNRGRGSENSRGRGFEMNRGRGGGSRGPGANSYQGRGRYSNQQELRGGGKQSQSRRGGKRQEEEEEVVTSEEERPVRAHSGRSYANKRGGRGGGRYRAHRGAHAREYNDRKQAPTNES